MAMRLCVKNRKMIIKQSSDGSLSAFDESFGECYHSLKDGALSETLYKHIFPSLLHFGILEKSHADKIANCLCIESNATNCIHTNIKRDSKDFITPNPLHILDICFGLGYNTFGLLATLKHLGFLGELKLYSPESNDKLFQELPKWQYPRAFEANIPNLKSLLHSLESSSTINLKIPFKATLQIHKGEAIDFIQTIPSESIHIIYQDAFSPSKNPTLWSESYFKLLYDKLRSNGIITTYSQARAVRENAKNAGFLVYNYESKKVRGGSLMSKNPLKLDNLTAIH